MERNSINPQVVKIRLKDGITKIPCAPKRIIRIEVPLEQYFNGIELFNHTIKIVRPKRNLWERIYDFFYPKYITVYYSETFDNSVHPMLFRTNAGRSFLDTAYIIEPNSKFTFYTQPPLSPEVEQDAYASISESFDKMIAAMEVTKKQALAEEQYEMVSRIHDVIILLRGYQEKMLNNIIENKGKAKRITLIPILKEMVAEIGKNIPEIAAQLQVLTKFKFKD